MWENYMKARKSIVLDESPLEYRDYAEDEYNTFFNMDTIDIGQISTVYFPSFSKGSTDEDKFKEYQDIIKRHIMNYGALFTAIATPDSDRVYFNSETNAECYLGDYNDLNMKRMVHAVTIIGWDDNYSRENFNESRRPEKDGAYICLNSWGVSQHDNGYFYVSYEDAKVHTDLAGITGVGESEKKNNNLSKLSDIGNKKIEDAIKEKYEIETIDGEEYIDNKLFDEITFLSLDRRDITSLKGVEKFKNLVSISLAYNNITDVSPLKECKNLEYIYLSNNNVRDVSSLATLEKLKYLYLANNKNVKGYEKCTNLVSLNLTNCNIESVENLNNLEGLRTLFLGNNQIKDFEKLNYSNITEIGLADCNFTNLELLTNNEKVYYSIDISGNGISDLSKLDNELKIGELYLDENAGITDYSYLNDMDIAYLYANSCNIEDIAILPTTNENINGLFIGGNNIKYNLDKLKEFPSLYLLSLRNCNLKDISELNGIDCQEIILDNNPGIHGNLKDMIVYELSLIDCNLDEEFNFFENENVSSYELKGNQVDFSKIKASDMVAVYLGEITENQYSFENVPENVMIYGTMRNKEISAEEFEKFPKNVTITGLTVKKEIIIPEGKEVYLYTMDIKDRISEIDGEKIETYIPTKVDITNAKTIMCSYSKEFNNNKVIYTIKKSDSIKFNELRVSKKLPSVDRINDNTFDNILIEAKYADGIYAAIDDFELWYDKDNVHEGKNIVKISKDGIEKVAYITVSGDKKYITLKFSDESLYQNISGWLRESTIRDDNTKTLKLTPEEVAELETGIVYDNGEIYTGLDKVNKAYPPISVPYESMYDINALQGLNPERIIIEFSENSEEKLKLEDFDKLKIFNKLQSITIRDFNPSKTKKDRITQQDKYMINYYNKGLEEVDIKLTTLDLNDENLYNVISSKFDDLYIDMPIILKISLTDEQVKKIKDDMLVIPYTCLQDVASLKKLKLESIGIEFSKDMDKDKMITEADLSELNKLPELKSIYIVDHREMPTNAKRIVNQSKYTVYINGELQEKKGNGNTNSMSNNAITNNTVRNTNTNRNTI